MNILSIDWDFFFPDVIPFDWGHREDMLSIETLWSLRAGNRNLFTQERAIDAVKPNENLLSHFWEKVIYRPDCISNLIIAESHSDIKIALLIEKENIVVNIDQHHDIHYGQPNKKEEPKCDNWASWGIKNNRIKRFHQFYPKWRKETPENPSFSEVVSSINPKKGTTITENYGLKSNFLPFFFDIVFICRSGAWTPTWHDNQWIKFITWWEKFPKLYKNKIHSPFALTKRKPDYQEAEKIANEFEKILKEEQKTHAKTVSNVF